MKLGDLTSGATKLNKSWKKLNDRWEETKTRWRNVVSREIEEQHLAPLEQPILSVLERMKTLTGILENAAHECEK